MKLATSEKSMPCPVCGEKPFFKVDIIDDSYFMGYSIGCQNNFLHELNYFGGNDLPQSKRFAFYGLDKKEKAIDVWNRRVQRWLEE